MTLLLWIVLSFPSDSTKQSIGLTQLLAVKLANLQKEHK
jgi:hypothetical protein